MAHPVRRLAHLNFGGYQDANSRGYRNAAALPPTRLPAALWAGRADLNPGGYQDSHSGTHQDSHLGGHRNAGRVQMRRDKMKMPPEAHRTQFAVPKASFWHAVMVPSAHRTRFVVPKARFRTVEMTPWAHRTRNVVSKAAYRLTKRRPGHTERKTLCEKRHMPARNAAYDTQLTKWCAAGGISARETPPGAHRTRNVVPRAAYRLGRRHPRHTGRDSVCPKRLRRYPIRALRAPMRATRFSTEAVWNSFCASASK